MKRLQDKVALVTGGGRGIGRAICLAFAREGAHLVIAARTTAEIEEVVQEVRALGQRALAVPCDISDEEQVRDMVEGALEAFSRLDILVNNAGIQIRASVVEMKVEDWDAVINVNLRGAFLCTKYVLPEMIKRREGKIINISSDSGKRGWATGGAYCASKFGLLGLTESVALEVMDYNINVNAICPGGVATRMSEEVLTPDGRHYDTTGWMTSEEIADVAVFLASKESRAMYGAAIDVYGKAR